MVRFILPVRDLRRGKSRLQVVDRPAMVTAMLLDTLEAVLGAQPATVVLVSPDPLVATIAHEYAVEYLAHPGTLNEAIAAAVTPQPCAAILPDLPTLRPEDVTALARAGRGFVPDSAGTGTTMAIAASLTPVFGPDSARAFGALGLPRLNASASARCDVDDLQGLAVATRLGLGRHTRAVLDEKGPARRSRTGPS